MDGQKRLKYLVFDEITLFKQFQRFCRGRFLKTGFELEAQNWIAFKPFLLAIRPWTSGLPGHIASGHFWQLFPHKEFQKMVIMTFVQLEKINIFCFMHKSVVQKLSLPRPFENQILNGYKSANFEGRDFSIWI